jgi:peptidoglycan-associated lipoprotein
MTRYRSNKIVLLAVVVIFAFVSGCHKHVASTSAPARPPQPSPAPAATSSPSVAKTNNSAVPQPTPAPTLDQLFRQNVEDAFFDYDQSALTAADRASLSNDAEFLRSHPEVRFTIEGHCDERGSEEYNLGLGDRRATSAKRYLVDLGIADSRIQTTSFGKERPFCTQQSESCWSQNRRAHFTMAQ